MSKSTSLFPVEEEKKEEVVDTTATEETKSNIIDVDLSVTAKKKIRINGDNSRILYLNTSDFGILSRLEEGYNNLNDLMAEVAKNLSSLPDKSEDELQSYSEYIKILEDLDAKMRVQVDYIFDSNVSEICASEGSMWDPIEGSFRYEHIIDVLLKVYETNLDKEFKAMKARMSKHTAKYKQAVGKSKYHK